MESRVTGSPHPPHRARSQLLVATGGGYHVY